MAALIGAAACHHDVPQAPKSAAPAVNKSVPLALASFSTQQVVALPWGTEVPVGQSGDGEVVILPYGTVHTSAIWNRLDLPVCWDIKAVTTIYGAR